MVRSSAISSKRELYYKRELVLGLILLLMGTYFCTGENNSTENTFTISKLKEIPFQLGQDDVYYLNDCFYILGQNEQKGIYQVNLEKKTVNELLRADNILGIHAGKLLFSLTEDIHHFYACDLNQNQVSRAALSPLFKELNIYFPITQVSEQEIIAVKPLSNGEYGWFKMNLAKRWGFKIGSFFEGGKIIASPDGSIVLIQQQKSILLLNGHTYAPLGEIKYSHFGTEDVICQFISNQLILLQFYTPGAINWLLFNTSGQKVLKFLFALKGEKLDTIYFAPSLQKALAFTNRKLLILNTSPFYQYLLKANLLFQPQVGQINLNNLGVFYSTAGETYAKVPLRSRPDENATPLAYYDQPESVRILERSGIQEQFLGASYYYYKIQDLQNRQGWVWGAYLDLFQGYLGEAGKDQLALLKYPDPAALPHSMEEPLGYLAKGETVEILQAFGQGSQPADKQPVNTQAGWYLVKKQDGPQGWVARIDLTSLADESVPPPLPFIPSYTGLLKEDSATLYDDILSPTPQRIGKMLPGSIMHILSIRRSKNTATNKTDYWYQIRLAGIQNDLPAQAPLKTGWLKAETVTLYKYNDWLTATGEIEGRLHYTGYPAQSPLVATLIDAETLKPVYLPDYEHEKRFTYKIRFSLRVLPGRYYLLFIPQHLLEQPAATTYLKQLMQTTDGTYVPLVVQPAGVTTGGEFWPDFSLEKYLNKK